MIELSRFGFGMMPLVFGGIWAVVSFLALSIANIDVVKDIHADVLLVGGTGGLIVYLASQAGSSLLPGVVGFLLTFATLEAFKRIPAKRTETS